MNCSGLLLKVAYIHHPFFVYNGTDQPNGVDYELLRTLANYLKFKFELITPVDGEWGARVRGGKWTGMIGLLQRKEADIGISSISMTMARQKVVDFSVPYSYDALTFITRSRNEPYPRKVFFLLPFPPEVWVLIILAFLVCTSLLFQFQTVYRELFLKWKTPRSWKLLQIILKQDLDLQSFKSSRCFSSRFLLGSWLISVGVLFQYYCSMLTSTVSVPMTLPTIDTVDDLADAVRNQIYKFGMLKGNAFEDMILESTSGPMSVFRETIVNNLTFQYPKNAYSALRRVAFGDNFAYLEQKRSIEIMVNDMKIKNKVHFPRENFFVDRLGIAFRKGFDRNCYKSFNIAMRRLGATGILRKLNTRHKLHSIAQRGNKIESQNYIDIQDLQSLFFVIIIGYDLAFFVLVLETVFQRTSLFKKYCTR